MFCSAVIINACAGDFYVIALLIGSKDAQGVVNGVARGQSCKQVIFQLVDGWDAGPFFGF